MRTALSEIVADIHQSRKTGLLSISVKGASTLFKMYFREGEIYHISCGNLKGSECLAHCDGVEFSECTFIPGIKLAMTGTDIPPVSEIVSSLRVAAKTVDTKLLGGETDGPSAAPAGGSFGAISDRLKTSLIRQIGPAGGRIYTRIVEVKWRASSPPTKADILDLIKLLEGEIDDLKDRNEFLREVSKIISP